MLADYELPLGDADQPTDVGRETIQGFQEVAFALDLPQELASRLYEFTGGFLVLWTCPCGSLCRLAVRLLLAVADGRG